jgi:HSP20 family protein
MAINRWSPVGELASLHTAMDRLFGDFFGGTALDADRDGTQATGTWYLPLDIVDAGSSYQVKAAVPGFKPEDVEVTFHDGMLNIVARRKEESTSQQGRYLRRELRVGNFARSVQLPAEIRPEEIKADFESGILTVEIPKAAVAKPIKIAVSGKPQKQPVGTAQK